MAHRNRRHRRTHPAPYASIYSSQFTPAELATIAASYRNLTLRDEIWALRVLNRRLLARLNPKSASALSAHQFSEIGQMITRNNGRIAHLIADQHAYDQAEAQSPDPVAHFLARALHDLSATLSPSSLNTSSDPDP